MIVSLPALLRRHRMNRIKPFGKSPPPCDLRVSLCDTSPEVADRWLESFFDVDGVEILRGSLLDCGRDAIVSPANSFGEMSGGLDKAIDDHYGGAAQTAATTAIRDRFYGELPVGMALVLPMPGRPPFLIVAPTMRVPRGVSGTINAYLALRAALVAILTHNRDDSHVIRSVGVPGLCTGVGAMSPGEAARQMRVAYDNILGGDWVEVTHPALAPFAFGPQSHRRWQSPQSEDSP